MQDAAAEVDNLRGLYKDEVDQRTALEEALENLRRDYEAKLNATAFDLRSWVGRSQKKEAQARAAEAEKARAAQERAAALAAEAEAARAAEVRSAAALREVETSLVHADAARVARRIQMRRRAVRIAAAGVSVAGAVGGAVFFLLRNVSKGE